MRCSAVLALLPGLEAYRQARCAAYYDLVRSRFGELAAVTQRGLQSARARGILAGPDERFTRRGAKALWLVLFGFYTLLLFAGAVATGVPLWARALACAGILIFVATAWRVLQLAVTATPDRLVIRNFRNTHRVPWADVAEVYGPRLPPLSAYLENSLAEPTVGLFVRLREGAVISCTLYRSGTRGNWRQINEVAARLWELRERYTQGVAAIGDVAGSAPDLLS